MSTEFIDAHHHLWKYSPEHYSWIVPEMERIRRDFLIPELKAVAQEAEIEGTIAVQARQSLDETRWLLDLAVATDLIRGIVGWVPLIDIAVTKHLEAFATNPKFKGVRHVLHDEADDLFMLREDFNRGVSQLKDFGLRYDILIFERHLSQTIQFVDRHPKQIFVVDHIAKPRISERVRSPWQELITELSRRENVYCKLSGMATEANWKNWSQNDLAPYFDTILHAFGPRRLMFGSDWPVILLASEYKHWVDVVRSRITELSTSEQDAIMGGTAKLAYSL